MVCCKQEGIICGYDECVKDKCPWYIMWKPLRCYTDEEISNEYWSRIFNKGGST